MNEADCLVRGLASGGADVILISGARLPRDVYLWVGEAGMIYRARAEATAPLTFRLTFVEQRAGP